MFDMEHWDHVDLKSGCSAACVCVGDGRRMVGAGSTSTRTVHHVGRIIMHRCLYKADTAVAGGAARAKRQGQKEATHHVSCTMRVNHRHHKVDFCDSTVPACI
jgi:hypothetical protein